MQALFLLSGFPQLHFRLGTSDRVSTGNGLQPLLEFALILCCADCSRRFNKTLALALRFCFRCLRHVQIAPSPSLSHFL